MTTKNRVFITNYNCATCAGYGVDTLWNSLMNQKVFISMQDGYLHDKKACIGIFNLNNNFYELLIKLTEDVLINSKINPKETILMIGSSVGGMQNTEKKLFCGYTYNNIDPNFHTIATIENILKSNFNFKDSFAFSTACTSSANALGFAFECINKNIYKQILVIGADAISHTTVCGFNSLGVLSDLACKPFDISHAGMNVSEGIGILLLQNKKTKNSIEFLGSGYSSDAYHMTHPEPNAKGQKAAILNALNCANITPCKINYINAHGTGTKANDTTEAIAIASVFQNKPFVSSTKGVTGHALGAAGAIEAIIACESIKHDIVPKNIGLSIPQNKECNFAMENTKHIIQYAMSNSFAFGGNNTSLIFGKPN